MRRINDELAGLETLPGRGRLLRWAVMVAIRTLLLFVAGPRGPERLAHNRLSPRDRNKEKRRRFHSNATAGFSPGGRHLGSKSTDGLSMITACAPLLMGCHRHVQSGYHKNSQMSKFCCKREGARSQLPKIRAVHILSQMQPPRRSKDLLDQSPSPGSAEKSSQIYLLDRQIAWRRPIHPSSW